MGTFRFEKGNRDHVLGGETCSACSAYDTEEYAPTLQPCGTFLHREVVFVGESNGYRVLAYKYGCEDFARCTDGACPHYEHNIGYFAECLCFPQE